MSNGKNTYALVAFAILSFAFFMYVASPWAFSEKFEPYQGDYIYADYDVLMRNSTLRGLYNRDFKLPRGIDCGNMQGKFPLPY